MRISTITNNMRLTNLYLERATNQYNKSAERIATGKKLSTDIVGQLGQLNSLKAHKATAEVEISNFNSAKDFITVKDGALGQINDLAQKIYSEHLSEEANTDLIDAYAAEITNILSNTKYNGKNVFQNADISFGSGFSITKSGLVSDASGTLNSSLKFDTADDTKAFMEAVTKDMSITGAQSNALDARININTRTVSALEESISRIEDVDVAEENINLAKASTQQLLAANMLNMIQEQQGNIINLLI